MACASSSLLTLFAPVQCRVLLYVAGKLEAAEAGVFGELGVAVEEEAVAAGGMDGAATEFGGYSADCRREIGVDDQLNVGRTVDDSQGGVIGDFLEVVHALDLGFVPEVVGRDWIVNVIEAP